LQPRVKYPIAAIVIVLTVLSLSSLVYAQPPREEIGADCIKDARGITLTPGPAGWRKLDGWIVVPVCKYVNCTNKTDRSITLKTRNKQTGQVIFQTVLAPGESFYLHHGNPDKLPRGKWIVTDPPGVITFEWIEDTGGDGEFWLEVQAGVGGFAISVDKFGLLTPYIGLASTTIIAAIATVVYVKRVKPRKEKQ